MVICSRCNHREILGALFCSECGMQLDPSAGSQTESFNIPAEIDDKQVCSEDAVLAHDSRLTLYLSAHDATIQLDTPKEYSIGRVSEGQKVLPDVDLAPFDGFNNGVSRLHASILIDDKSIEVKDLGSSNGSILNEQKLIPHVPYVLSDGDVLIFGKLVARVLLKS